MGSEDGGVGRRADGICVQRLDQRCPERQAFANERDQFVQSVALGQRDGVYRLARTDGVRRRACRRAARQPRGGGAGPARAVGEAERLPRADDQRAADTVLPHGQAGRMQELECRGVLPDPSQAAGRRLLGRHQLRVIGGFQREAKASLRVPLVQAGSADVAVQRPSLKRCVTEAQVAILPSVIERHVQSENGMQCTVIGVWHMKS
mmetsp:Transcript_13442/g.34273  ORF Transcript_13442/g.34273 Transcript_13442/m.34273 type:complete len:206 (+) Transcript_13442:1783-2400(+)